MLSGRVVLSSSLFVWRRDSGDFKVEGWSESWVGRLIPDDYVIRKIPHCMMLAWLGNRKG
jgi:hypothetical protein